MEEQKALASGDFEGVDAAKAKQMKITENKTVKQMRGFATVATMAGETAAAGSLSERAGIQKALGVAGKGKRLQRLGSMFGLDISKKDIDKALKEGGTEGVAKLMAGRMGAEGFSEEQRALLEKAISGAGARTGEGLSGAAMATQQLLGASNVQKSIDARKDQEVQKRAEDYKPMGLAIANELMSQLRNETLKVKRMDE
jgi:hypothetical protein